MTSLRHINLLVAGETGTGKSSVINLIFNDENRSKVSTDATGCTNQCSIYQGLPQDYPQMDLKIYDTIGIEESDEGTVPRKDSFQLFEQLFDSMTDGLHLLLFCIKMGRLTKTVEKSYQLFEEILLGKQIPCVLVITHCEYENQIGNWWKENQIQMKKSFFPRILDAVSITTLKQTQRGNDLTNEYNLSRKILLDAINKYSLVNQTNFLLRKDLFFSKLQKLVENDEKISLDLLELSQKNMSLPHLIFFIDLYSTNVEQINQSRFFYQKLTNDFSRNYAQISIRSYFCLFKLIEKIFPSNGIEEFLPQPSGSMTLIFIRHPKVFHHKLYLIRQQIKKLRCLISLLNGVQNRRFYLNENPYCSISPNLQEYNQQLHSIPHLNPFKLNGLPNDFPLESMGIFNEGSTKIFFQSIELILQEFFNQYNLNE